MKCISLLGKFSAVSICIALFASDAQAAAIIKKQKSCQMLNQEACDEANQGCLEGAANELSACQEVANHYWDQYEAECGPIGDGGNPNPPGSACYIQFEFNLDFLSECYAANTSNLLNCAEELNGCYAAALAICKKQANP